MKLTMQRNALLIVRALCAAVVSVHGAPPHSNRRRLASLDRGARRDRRARLPPPVTPLTRQKKPAPLLRVSRLRVPHQLRVVRRRHYLRMVRLQIRSPRPRRAGSIPSRRPRAPSRRFNNLRAISKARADATPRSGSDPFFPAEPPSALPPSPRPRARPAPIPPTPTLTPPRSIAHHSLPCRCGNDPYAAGGCGMTGQGDHHEGNPFSPHAYSVNGIGKVKLLDTSTDAYDATDTDSPAKNQMWMGQNTVFTKQFRGYASYKSDATALGTNPFKLVVVVAGVTHTHAVHRVYSDTLLEVESWSVDVTNFVPFTLGTPRGTGSLKFGPQSTEVVLPNSASKEQLTIVCGEGSNDLPTDPTPSAACKFSKELKVGYWLVLDHVDPPQTRVITNDQVGY